MNPVTLYVVDNYLLTRIAHRRNFANDNEIFFLEDFSNAEDCIKKMKLVHTKSYKKGQTDLESGTIDQHCVYKKIKISKYIK